MISAWGSIKISQMISTRSFFGHKEVLCQNYLAILLCFIWTCLKHAWWFFCYFANKEHEKSRLQESFLERCQVWPPLPNSILYIYIARLLFQWCTLPETPVHCGIEMSTCTLTVHFTQKQNALKLLILGRF